MSENIPNPSEDGIKVYYNSACPVCNAGIGQQKDRMAACAVQWKDVHTDVGARREIPSELEFVRERLHAVDEHGEVKVGVDAIELIWRHSPGERWKASLISLPGIRQLAALAYNLFARLLYRWNLRRGHWQKPG